MTRTYFQLTRGSTGRNHFTNPANMTLDGLEDLIMDNYPKMKVNFVRYTDDFVVTAPTKRIAKEVRSLISEFLAKRGLTLSETKTKITHIDDGFDFLVYNIRKYRGILLMKPSKESVKKITRKISEIIHKTASWTQEQLIQTLQ